MLSNNTRDKIIHGSCLSNKTRDNIFHGTSLTTDKLVQDSHLSKENSHE